MVAALGDSVSFYKIGMELAYGGGLPFAKELIDGGKAVFLDLKLHDIPTTVEKACANVARLGARFLTVHAYPQTMAAAARGAAGSGLKILGVTVLTSCDDADLAEAGFAFGVKELVARRANQARAAGIDGLILSAEELAPVRRIVGPDMILVTPGIRPAGADRRGPETGRNARGGDSGRRRSSRRRAADHPGEGPARRGAGDPRRNRRRRRLDSVELALLNCCAGSPSRPSNIPFHPIRSGMLQVP